MKGKKLKDLSKEKLCLSGDNIDPVSVIASALIRIADSLEIMTMEKEELSEEIEQLKVESESRNKMYQIMSGKYSAVKGQLIHQSKKIESLTKEIEERNSFKTHQTARSQSTVLSTSGLSKYPEVN